LDIFIKELLDIFGLEITVVVFNLDPIMSLEVPSLYGCSV